MPAGPGPCTASGYRIIVAEKPKAAYRIARALSGGAARRCEIYKVPYWVFRMDGSLYIVAPAAGHLFGLKTDERGFPVFSYRWVPIFEAERGAEYTKKFYYALKKLFRGALEYINACDYDIEGSLIGYMIIKEFGDPSRARRMKFSSLTEEELRQAFRNLRSLDVEMVEAGMCRHELDWLWGINVSRALMDAVRKVTGRRVILSAGRVQSPTLIEAVNRDMSRRLFVPLPLYGVRVYVEINGEEYLLEALGGPYETEAEARRLAAEIRRAGYAEVVKVDKRVVSEQPPPPFNLGDLQSEASRIYGFSPMRTQQIAEQLYLNALISYPRTNSQKLPPTLNYKRIMESLGQIEGYGALVKSLLLETGGTLKPRQGRKDDPAHPAIYPTGRRPYRLNADEWKIYDLIVRRFLAAFAPPHKYERSEAILTAGGARFKLTGLHVLERGWTRYYPFVSRKEALLPPLRPGDRLKITRVSVSRSYTKPPQPYTKASLVKWMEAVNIGTEATRARISEVLFKREYLRVAGGKIEATDLGLSVAEVLKKYFPDLTSVELTRRFEEYMDSIRRGTMKRDEVISKAHRLLENLLSNYVEKLHEAGTDISKSLGLLKPEKRCPLCGRESVEEQHGFCRYHSEAYKILVEAGKEWARRSGISGRDYYKRIASMKNAGKWVREVASHLIGG